MRSDTDTDTVDRLSESLSLPSPPFPPGPLVSISPSPHTLSLKKVGVIKLSIIIFHNFQGESIGPNEATEAFFAMTKLFQSKDVRLRVINCLFHFTG